ncbi:MAG: CtsR family transcriptional regulator [Clostridiales bacterium]|nr:CtsR family transcriptional regulator [Clostridiales bacterium]HBM80297.1 CtsR family transcriptional regulator [Clostridiaceae bacterium]
MPRLSDLIEEFIKRMFEETDGDILEIQRNELANHFGCAPSQINYVLMTRFNTDRGYYIESKRGGGGSIRITRISLDGNDYLNKLISEKIGGEITQRAAESYIDAFLDHNLITEREASIMNAAINDKTINVQQEMRDSLRANILKSMLIVLLS